MSKLEELQKKIKSFADPEKAKILQRFFKTGKGQYGEGDIFFGLVVPIQREISKSFTDLSLVDLQKLIKSKIHEERMITLFILIQKYKKARLRQEATAGESSVAKAMAGEAEKKKYFDFYLKNVKYINNWDLVDLSAPNIVGDYLSDKPRKILYEMAKSEHLWTKRVSILATFIFIKNNDFKDSLRIAQILIHDEHDLIHKAVGWMLREVGKRDLAVLDEFLQDKYHKMPRTMLRYAIEKMEEKKRKKYLAK